MDLTAVYLTVITLLLLALLFILSVRNSNRVPNSVREDFSKKLEQIRLSIDANLVAANRDSIIRLDSLLSKALQIRMRNNLSCGENLKKSKSLFKKDHYEKLWEYHKLRNEIVHESVDVKTDDAKKAYRVYSKAITKLLQ